jgi:hypothetical protein
MARFDVTAVLNKDLSLNVEAWDKAAPLLLTPFLSVSLFRTSPSGVAMRIATDSPAQYRTV